MSRSPAHPSDVDPDREPRRRAGGVRNRQLVRQMSVLRLMLNGRLTLSEMARELHVHARTIRRDLEALEEAHLPVVSEFSWQDARAYRRVSLECCPVCKRAPVARQWSHEDEEEEEDSNGRTVNVNVREGGSR